MIAELTEIEYQRNAKFGPVSSLGVTQLFFES